MQIITDSQGKEYQLVNGTAYHKETSAAVISKLERCRECKDRIRVFYGDTKTGKAWPEENDVSGYIGRSTGSVKIPLLVNNSRSMGGGGLLDHCIVAIKYRHTWLYRHESFDTGAWEASYIEPHSSEDFSATVMHNGSEHARFKRMSQALNFCRFMRGERNSK